MRNQATTEELCMDGMVTVKDAAAFLQMSISSVYLLMERGKLTYAKIGRSRRIPRRALLGLAAESLVGIAEP